MRLALIAAFALLAGPALAACPDGRINVNTDDARELGKLPGIGKKKAAAIVEYRKTGSFDTLDQVTRVKGVGKKTVAKWAGKATTDCAGKAAAMPAADQGARVAPKSAPVGKINLNAATAAALTKLPGIGKKTAAAIVAEREKLGRFTSVDQLKAIKGIGKKKLAKLRALVTVE